MAFSTQDEEQRWLKHAYTKPIDVDTIIWVKKRIRLLEVRGQYSSRIAVFDEFYLETGAEI